MVNLKALKFLIKFDIDNRYPFLIKFDIENRYPFVIKFDIDNRYPFLALHFNHGEINKIRF